LPANDGAGHLIEINTPHAWLARMARVPLIGGLAILLVALVPATVLVSVVTVPLRVSSQVGTGISCLASTVWVILLEYVFHTRIRLLFIPLWIVLPVVGVLGLLGVLD
jgi:hypothetical protein